MAGRAMATAMTSTARAMVASHGVAGEVASRQPGVAHLLTSAKTSMRKGTNALVHHSRTNAQRRPRDSSLKVTMTATVPSSSVKGAGRTRPTSDPAAPNFIPIPSFEECFPSSTKETKYPFSQTQSRLIMLACAFSEKSRPHSVVELVTKAFTNWMQTRCRSANIFSSSHRNVGYNLFANWTR